MHKFQWCCTINKHVTIKAGGTQLKCYITAVQALRRCCYPFLRNVEHVQMHFFKQKVQKLHHHLSHIYLQVPLCLPDFHSHFIIFKRCFQVEDKNILSRIRDPLPKHAPNFITVQLEVFKKNFSKFYKMNTV